MHTEPPPSAALEAWLDANGTIEDRYGHLLLEQIKPIDKSLIDALRPYFESAHLDAREHFHKQVGIDLHPDASATGAHACYPDCLPAVARRGLFGEVIAGLVTQAYAEELVGEHQWSVPIFLFRFHADVESYLWDLRYDPSRKRQIFGRFGSDFVGVRLDATGNVVRVIVGEAKWRASLTNSAVAALLHGEKNLKDPTTGKNVHNGRGIWFEVNRDSVVPKGLRQLQRLLELRDPVNHATAIASMDAAITATVPTLARTNLVVIAGNAAATRKKLNVLIPWEKPPADYTAPHDLQVVELIVEGGEALIDGLYTSMWKP